MDILIAVIISGFAVGYVVELVSSLLDSWVSPRLIKLLLTLPSSLVFLWTLGFNGPHFFVGSLAAAFVSLATMLFVSKPVEVTQVVNRR